MPANAKLSGTLVTAGINKTSPKTLNIVQECRLTPPLCSRVEHANSGACFISVHHGGQA
jgi:hypothetical protein